MRRGGGGGGGQRSGGTGAALGGLFHHFMSHFQIFHVITPDHETGVGFTLLMETGSKAADGSFHCCSPIQVAVIQCVAYGERGVNNRAADGKQRFYHPRRFPGRTGSFASPVKSCSPFPSQPGCPQWLTDGYFQGKKEQPAPEILP